MGCLERAAEEIVTQWGANRQKDREAVLNQMDKVIACCNEAVQVWEGIAKSPGSGANAFSVLPAVGAARAKQLHEISLKTYDALEQACRSTGAGRFMALDESLIEMAYRAPKPAETASEYAKTAVATMQQRIAGIRALMTRIKNAKPVAGRPVVKSAGKAAPKKAAKKASRKPVKKAAAPVAKKKPVKKSAKKAKRR